jgi:hypothetical protein
MEFKIAGALTMTGDADGEKSVMLSNWNLAAHRSNLCMAPHDHIGAKDAESPKCDPPDRVDGGD